MPNDVAPGGAGSPTLPGAQVSGAQVSGAQVSGEQILRDVGIEALIQILETSAYGVCITGPEHTWYYVNPAAERIIGKPFAELAGRDYLQHFPEHERAALAALETEQQQGDTSFYTNTVVRPDGTEVEITWSGIGLTVNGEELAPAIFHETTPVRRARRTAAAVVVAARAAGRTEKPELLDALLEEGVRGTRAVAAAVLLDDGGGRLRVAAGYGAQGVAAEAVQRSGARLADLPGADELIRGRGIHLSDGIARYQSGPATRHWFGAADGTAGIAQFPVRGLDRVTGVLLAVFPADVTSPSEAELAYWSSLADETGVVVDTEFVRRVASESSAQSERHRIARDLHDSVSQALFTLQACAAAVRRGLAAGDTQAAGEAAGLLEDLSRQASAEMRDLLTRMAEPSAGAADLVSALRELVGRAERWAERSIAFTATPEKVDLSSPVVEHVVRIVGEALHNAHKHSAAGTVQVAVTLDADRLRVRVQDDGVGFDPAVVRSGGMGRQTMRERAELCGGELSVHSAPGAGTRVELQIPHTA